MSALFPTHSTTAPLNESLQTNKEQQLNTTRRKKQFRHQKPKLTVQQVTSPKIIEQAIKIGRRHSKKCNQQNQFQTLNNLLKDMQKWAAQIAPQYDIAEFTMAAQALSGNRQLRPMIADIRLAEMRKVAAQEKGIVLQDINHSLPVEEEEENENVVVAEQPPPDIDENWEEPMDLLDDFMMQVEGQQTSGDRQLQKQNHVQLDKEKSKDENEQKEQPNCVISNKDDEGEAVASSQVNKNNETDIKESKIGGQVEKEVQEEGDDIDMEIMAEFEADE